VEPAAAGILFRVERRFERPREQVFRAWTDPGALTRWWCPEGWMPAEIEMDLRVGGDYRIGMRRAAGGTSVYVCGTFLEVDRPQKLAYTWRWVNAFESMPPTRVTVQFVADGAATILVLTHGRIPDAVVCLQHRSGWVAALERVARVL
jgi:uncharacterized protein YndB with AHSA1/START domain